MQKLVILTGTVLGAFLHSAVAADVPAKVTYNDHVLPIFRNACLNCHNPDKKKAGLDLSSYSGALAVADELGARTVAFPLVSAGVYGWPRTDAVAAAVDTLRTTPTSVEEARFVAFGRSAYAEIAAALGDEA